MIGFAFANADLLVEISAAGRIDFAMGASEALSGRPETALVGRAWADFVAAEDRAVVAAFLEGLAAGQRAGPIVIRLAGPDHAASLNAFRLPQNKGAVSCALSRATYPKALPAGQLQARPDFEALACDLLQGAVESGKSLELSLVELGGLSAARAEGSVEQRAALEARLAGALRAQAYGGLAATALEDDRFALVRASGEMPDALAARLTSLMQDATDRPIVAQADAVPLDGVDRPQQMLRALRYVLDSFGRDGAAWETPGSLLDALNRAIRETLDKAGALGAQIRERRFTLAYQPVVSLMNGRLHHYETLVRFGEDESPFPQIRMAEEMDLIEGLDLAILEAAIAAMTAAPDLNLAVNVSGRTIMSAEYVAHAVSMLAQAPGVRGRLMLELTESAAVDDLAVADQRLQTLRAQGCEIALDDFGSGAASLAYLQQLKLDVLKIDGRYIRDLQYGGREAAFVRHLVGLCRELNIRTIAEMVETTAAELAIRKAGVDMAQGWLYGAATDVPTMPLAKHKWQATG